MTMTNVTFPEDARIHHATKGKAERLNSMLAAEYPRITVVATLNDDMKPSQWNATYRDDERGNVDIYEGEKLPDVTDLIEACQAEDLDPEAGSEPAKGGSVVDDNYRQQYRESSTNGQTCGDWLAETLVSLTHTAEGFHFEDFEHLLSANGVDLTAKWAQIQRGRGWQGRYRMNGRQVLEKLVAWRGVLFDHQGNQREMPEPDLGKLRAKHSKWIMKEEKRQAKEAEKAEAAEGTA